ncbi:MAG: saccharopine dehydrogenase C-terminal domain-containing protein [Pseudomonadota bacterium]
MKALVLGLGLQGKAVIHDLSQSGLVDDIIGADMDISSAEAFLKRGSYPKVRLQQLNIAENPDLAGFMKQSGAAITVCMLPTFLAHRVAKACIAAGIPFVNTSYSHWIEDLDGLARERGVTLLPEMGFDPGIDLILGGMAVADFDEVHGMNSYGLGVPELSAADNAIKYKITWTLEGVLNAYRRTARLLKDGRTVDIPGTEIFREENIHLIHVPGVGNMEAYANGDAIEFIDRFGLGPKLKDMGRYAARWPGHSAYWRVMAEMGFLEDEPLKFLVEHLTPRLQYRENERDVAVLRIEAWGLKQGSGKKITYEVIDYRDLETGLFAMNRTVGFTASIAAQLILSGEVNRPGVLSPIADVPGKRVLEELQLRNIQVVKREEEMAS